MTTKERKEILIDYLRDKDYTFTVYHIPGVKVGCDHDINRIDNRPRQLGHEEWEVLHQTKDIFEASDLEIKELRKRGFKVDGNYWNTYVSSIITNRRRWKQGRQKMIDSFVKAGEIASREWRKNNPKRVKEIVSKAAKATAKSINRSVRQMRSCPHCGKITNALNSKRWHFDKCRFK